jgi:hypothetical protein
MRTDRSIERTGAPATMTTVRGAGLALAAVAAGAATLIVAAPGEAAVKNVSRPEAQIRVISCMTRNALTVEPKCVGNPRRPPRLTTVLPGNTNFKSVAGWAVLVRVEAPCRDGGQDVGPMMRDYTPVTIRVKGNVHTANFQTPKTVTLCQQKNFGSGGADVWFTSFRGGTGFALPHDWRRSKPGSVRANGAKIASGRATAVTRVLRGEPFGGKRTTWRYSHWTT